MLFESAEVDPADYIDDVYVCISQDKKETESSRNCDDSIKFEMAASR